MGCSVNMGKVLDAAKNACPEVAKMDQKTKETVCQTVKSMKNALDLAGVDITKPTSLEKYQWGIVCFQYMLFQTEVLTEQQPMVEKCSPTMQTLFDQAKKECSSFEEQTSDVKNDKAVCQTVAAMEGAMAVGSYMDLSDPSKFSKMQWVGLCPNLLLVPVDQHQVYKKCSDTMGKLLSASTTKCKEDSACSGATQMVSMLQASGIDFSDPKGLSDRQVEFFCAQYGSLTPEQKKVFKECSDKMTKLFADGDTICTGAAGSQLTLTQTLVGIDLTKDDKARTQYESEFRYALRQASGPGLLSVTFKYVVSRRRQLREERQLQSTPTTTVQATALYAPEAKLDVVKGKVESGAFMGDLSQTIKNNIPAFKSVTFKELESVKGEVGVTIPLTTTTTTTTTTIVTTASKKAVSSAMSLTIASVVSAVTFAVAAML